jgi:glutamate 5-kinase
MSSLVVKLGSSIVADDRGDARLDVLGRICDELAALHRSGYEVVVVTSGAIAHGMGKMGFAPAHDLTRPDPIRPRPRPIDELQAASAVGQGKLYQVYDELLRARGITSAQILLTFFDMSARTHYLNARQTLRKLLEWHVVPIINENDTTTTDEISFGNNDFLAAQVAILLSADLLVLLTDAEGVFTADPRIDSSAALVDRVDDFGALTGLDIGHTTSALGTGGMRSKVVAAEMATAAGVPVVIAGGLTAGTITRAAAGEPVGTSFPAREGRYSSFKLWLKYAKPTRGQVTVDAGAARALRDGGTSLLPVGIVEVNGRFDAGDAVEIVHGADAVGKGICNYSADELRQVRGLQSVAVRELLPRASEEAIHRDYFVLA